MRLARGLVLLFVECTHPNARVVTVSPRAQQPVVPVVPAPDFGEVVHGCEGTRLRLARLGGSLVLVGVRVTQSHLRAVALDVATGEQREISPSAGVGVFEGSLDNIDVRGTSLDAFELELVGGCAPDLEAPEQPVRCTQSTIVVRGTESSVKNDTTSGGERMAPKPAAPPAGWERDFAAWKKSAGSCDIATWLPLAPSYAFVRATPASACAFGQGAVLHREHGTLKAAVEQGEDGTLLALHAEQASFVGHGVDGRIDILWKVTDDGLADAGLPGAADNTFVDGDHIWTLTVQTGLYVRSGGTWQHLTLCDPGKTESAYSLDDQRVVVNCESGVVMIAAADTGAKLLGYAAPKDTTWTALAKAGSNDVTLVDETHGTLLQSRYTGPTWTCDAKTPARFVQAQ